MGASRAGREVRALEAAYTGEGSTVEGSFAGDILRACADGCAELWSTEIDGLEERAVAAAQRIVDEKRPIGADARVRVLKGS